MKQKKIILALLVLAVFPLFFFFGPGYGSSRSFQCIWDLGHIFFFALGSYFLLSFSQFITEKTIWRQFFWIIIITLALGFFIEMIQGGFNREPDYLDMLRNLAGSMFAFFFFNPSKQALSGRKFLAFQLLTILIVVSALFPLAIAMTDELIADAEFPVLSDFETPFEKTRWAGGAQMKISNEAVYKGRSSLKVMLDTSRYSGVALEYFPGDWQGYSFLSFDAYNPSSEPIRITCRVHDRQHTKGVQFYSDRFNKSFLLGRGWNSIQINLEEVANAPKTRAMDMSDIRGLGIFSVQLPEPRVIFLDNVRLF
jgi:hypothetical protein